MTKWAIEHEVAQEGIRFKLVESAILHSHVEVPIVKWGERGKGRELVGAAQLIAWQDEEFIQSDEYSVLVPHERIAALNESVAMALGLPSKAPFLLNLQHSGTLDQSEFKFVVSWLHTNGQRLLGVARVGSVLKVGTKAYRIPNEVYQLLERVEAFNAASADLRLYHWALVQELLPETSAKSIKTDGYIQSTRIAHAAAFSLDLKSGADGFTFDPVLFGPAADEQATTNSDEDHTELVVSEAQQLLPDAQHEIFALKRFNQFDECNSRYALGDGWYVVFDTETRKALNVVRKMQLADRETRRSFAKNPRSFIRKELGDQIEEAALERLFIETSEFSQRVSDVGLWKRVVLPWVTRSNDSWVPEKFGLRIGEKYITVDPTDVPQIKAAAKEAIRTGVPTFVWGGEIIPASEETIQAIQSLVGLEVPTGVAEERPKKFAAEQDATLGPIVLVIDQNLNEVEYTRTLHPRTETVGDELPVALKTLLKEHQIEGLRWLKRSWAYGSSGALLADDMGLGKTLQALTFLAWLRERMDSRLMRHSPILIVAPVGLLKNWREEHSTHFHLPGLGNELLAYGDDLKRLRTKNGRETDGGEGVLDTHEIQRADWVLTTYETLRDYQHSFGSVRFAAIVYDEVQKIKTPGTLMTEAAQAMNGDFVLALTGTPVENRLADLWCIMDTLRPGELGDLREFSARYEKDPSEADLRGLKDQLMEPVNNAPATMLRRMKAKSLSGLPLKLERIIEKPMPHAQAELYNDAITRAKNSKDKGSMLKALQEFRSISLHPTHPDQAQSESYIKDSARLDATFEVLDEIQEKDQKALIFLESLAMQPVLASLIQRRFRLLKQPMLISGAVSGSKRQERVNEFQRARKGFDVIILSPRAGGVGLTLTAANHVIHLSRWWNPAVEDQCTDRVYRIGQNRDVHVYYPLAIHPAFADSSFDLRLHSLLEKKRSLSREMLLPPVDTSADTSNLFNQTVCQQPEKDETQDQPAKMSLEEIDTMEPLQFENWVLEKLKQNGFDVDRTPRSHDHGADGIATSRKTGTKIIVQCKHIQRDSFCDDVAVTDLLRARFAYGADSATYVAITNSKGFSKKATKMAAKENVQLISRLGLSSWPNSVIEV